MDTFREIIRSESQTLRELHEEVHRLVPDRDKSQWGFRKWADACSRFHQHQSELEPFLSDDALTKLRSCDPVMLEFTLEFLEEDPMFFRSGYLKEKMLRVLKQIHLSEPHKGRLRQILIDAVERRGRREFRRYCQMARAVVNAELKERLQELQLSPKPTVSSRAHMMMSYLQHAP